MYSRIKLCARLALNGSYLKTLPLLTLIIFSVFVFAFGNPLLNLFVKTKYSYVIFLFLSFLALITIVSPARLRLETKHFMLARGMKNIRVRTGFSEITKSLIFYPLIFLIKLFWFAVFEAVPVISAILLYFYLDRTQLSFRAFVVFCIGITVLAVAGICFFSLFIQRYSKAAFYLACYESFSALDAIKESVRKTRNSLKKILFFKLGFLPWFFLCIGIVPMLFVIPYYKQSLICFYLN